MLKKCFSCHTGSKRKYVKFISVVLTLVMAFEWFGIISLADAESDSVISDVKIIRSFNKDFSTKKIYDKGLWQAYALADENGDPIYFENNPIHVGGVYRGYDKIAYTNGETEYYGWIGKGIDGGRNSFGEKWDSDYPFAWNYDSVHASFCYTTEAYDANWNPIESSFVDMAGLYGIQELMFMDHYLVATEQTSALDDEIIGMYLFEEVFDEKIMLNEGETMEVYFEPDIDTEYSDLRLEFADNTISEYVSGKINGLKAGTTTATLTLKRADGSTFTKNYSVEVKSVSENQPTGFRCSKCDWYENQQKVGGITALFAKIVHMLIHMIERLTSRI